MLLLPKLPPSALHPPSPYQDPPLITLQSRRYPQYGDEWPPGGDPHRHMWANLRGRGGGRAMGHRTHTKSRLSPAARNIPQGTHPNTIPLPPSAIHQTSILTFCFQPAKPTTTTAAATTALPLPIISPSSFSPTSTTQPLPSRPAQTNHPSSSQ